MAHHYDLRVYIEDTDLGGIVYYANYLKFIERARSELVAQAGIDQMRLLEEEGLAFVVRKLTAEYIAPARVMENLRVATEVSTLGGASASLVQMVFRDNDLLFRAEIQIAVLAKNARPARLPAQFRDCLAAHLRKS